MKKNLLIASCLVSILFGISSVNALSFNDNGTVTNEQGYTMTSAQYNILKKDLWSNNDIDKMPQKMVEGIVARDYKFGTQTKHIVTTTTYDRLGMIIDVKQTEVSEEEAKKVISCYIFYFFWLFCCWFISTCTNYEFIIGSI